MLLVNSVLSILEEAHAMGIMLILLDRGPTRKTAIYREFNTNSTVLQNRIDSLKEAGLVSIDPDPVHHSAFLVSLTPIGREIAEHVRAIEDIWWNAIGYQRKGVKCEYPDGKK